MLLRRSGSGAIKLGRVYVPARGEDTRVANSSRNSTSSSPSFLFFAWRHHSELVCAPHYHGSAKDVGDASSHQLSSAAGGSSISSLSLETIEDVGAHHPHEIPSSAGTSSSVQTIEDVGARLQQHGLPPDHVSRILQALPAAKRTQVHFQHLLSLILFLQTMDVDTDKIPAFIRKAPFMYQRNPTLHLQPKILYLETLGLHRKDMCLLVLKYPYSLYPPMEDIQAQIQCLKSLPLEDQDLQRIISKTPMAFRLGADKYLQPKLNLFRSLGILQSDIRRVILTNPRVLATTLPKLQMTVDFLLGLGFQVGTAPFSKAFIRYAGRRCETLQLGVKNLLEAGLSQEEVELLVIRAPPVLARSRSIISSKFKYLVEVMNRLPNEVLKWPVFLLVSLDKRIRPRFEAIVQWRAEKQVENQYSLSYIFSRSDKVFSCQFPGIKVKSR